MSYILTKNIVLRQKAKPETEANSELSLKRLLCTEKEIKVTLAFLKEIKIATRKWILGKEGTEDKEVEWENIDREV